MDDEGACLWAPVSDTPSLVSQLEDHAASLQHQFNILLQQVQNLSAAVWNLQQNIAENVPPSSSQVHQQPPVSLLPMRSGTWEQELGTAYVP